MKLAPSILSADFTKLGEQIKELEENGIDTVHLDVMDGQFVPNISFGAPVIKAIREITDMKLDVHLMMDKPGRYIDMFIEAGADSITIHPETCQSPIGLMSYIKSKGVEVGIALSPSIPLGVLEVFYEKADRVLFMTVEPGFGGQPMINGVLKKIEEASRYKELNPSLVFQVDGGVTAENIKLVNDLGVDVAVAGSAIFLRGIASSIKELRNQLA